MNINETLKATNTFGALLDMANRAHARLTFFGKRQLSIEGCNGFVRVDALAGKLRKLITLNSNFDEDDRSIIEHITHKIDQLFEESYTQVENSNILTRICTYVRDLFDIMTPRDQWVSCDDRFAYMSYNKIQFERAFDIPARIIMPGREGILFTDPEEFRQFKERYRYRKAS